MLTTKILNGHKKKTTATLAKVITTDLFEEFSVLCGREASLDAALHWAVYKLPGFDELLLANRGADRGTHHLQAHGRKCHDDDKEGWTLDKVYSGRCSTLAHATSCEVDRAHWVAAAMTRFWRTVSSATWATFFAFRTNMAAALATALAKFMRTSCTGCKTKRIIHSIWKCNAYLGWREYGGAKKSSISPPHTHTRTTTPSKRGDIQVYVSMSWTNSGEPNFCLRMSNMAYGPDFDAKERRSEAWPGKRYVPTHNSTQRWKRTMKPNYNGAKFSIIPKDRKSAREHSQTALSFYVVKIVLACVTVPIWNLSLKLQKLLECPQLWLFLPFFF